MGCLCSKGISSNDYLDNLNRNKEINKSSRPLAVASIREDEAETGENGGFDQALEGLMYKKASEENSLSERVLLKQESIHPDIEEKNIAEAGKITNLPSNQFQLQLPRSSGVPNGTQGEQVAAGWPAWLAAVAGEAITGWIPRKAESFEKLDKIGQGTYSSVYRGRDVETGKTVAMKKVRFVNMDPESVRFMAREVIILRRLDHPNVMKLEGVVTSRVSGSVYLIFPYMEHDLAGLAAMSGIRFTEAQIKCYMQQLLRGLEHCHDRGVLHRDIKGSNLLIDDDGKMKIGDFGLSTFFEADQKKPLTSRVVTLWYRPPELLLGSTDYGPGVDLWSAGCILAELFYGKPIMPGRTEVEQLHKIFKLCGSPSEEYWRKSKLPHATIFKPQNPYRRCAREVFSDFPESALELLDVLLAIEPEKRCSASSVLQHEFLTSLPLPCSPSHLPKYPPSKEFDAKLRDEGARRKKTAAAAAAGKHHRGISATSRNASHDPKGMPAPRDANAESAISVQIQKRNNKKRSVEEDSHNKEVGVRGSGLSNSVAVRGSSSSVNEEVSTSSSWSNPPPPPPPPPDDNKHEWFRALLDAPKSSSSRKKTRPVSTAAMRVHYSGPLLPPGGNLEEALKEHEKQVQQAMRRARVGRTKAAPNAAAHRDSSLLRNPRVATRGGR